MVQNRVVGNPAQLIKPGLERMEEMMTILQPDLNKIKFIHIAGTNGKGSLGSYCLAILAAAGFKVGWFSSPHLQRKSECVRIIDGPAGIKKYLEDETYGEITARDYKLLDDQIRRTVNQTKRLADDPPSEFEVLTITALLHFTSKNCDWVIWEAGMGGKTDATNIIQNPTACMITAIGLDHVQWLGDSYEQIADHKAGIIKHHSQVYIYNPADSIPDPRTAENVVRIFKQKCLHENANLHILSGNEIIIDNRDFNGQRFHFINENNKYNYNVRQLGIYQPLLAAMAVRLFRDLVIDEKFISDGLSKAVWPGRMEIFRRKSENDAIMILDGAHNPQGCDALEKSLSYLLPDQNISFLLGVLEDKDVENMLIPVFKSQGYHTRTIICTKPENARAMTGAVLAEKIAGLTGRRPLRLQLNSNRMYNSPDHVFYSDDAAEALSFALELTAREKQTLCVFGSLYLAGIVRPLLQAAGNT